MSGEKILIVEDDPLLLPGFRRTLTDAGYDVTTADSGKKALFHIKETFFNLILSDIVMEGLDGMDLLEKVKELSPKTAVVLITGYGSIDTAIDAVKNNAADYLLKPCAKNDLKRRIREVLDKQKETSQEQEKKIKDTTNSVLKSFADKLDNPILNIECYADLMVENCLYHNSERSPVITKHVGNQLKNMTKKISNVVDVMKKSGRIEDTDSE